MSNNNTNNQKINVTTRGPQFYNTSSEDSNSTLVLYVWNDLVGIKIHPELERKTDNKIFNYQEATSVHLNLKQLYNVQKGLALLNSKTGKYTNFNIEVVDKDKVIRKLSFSKGEYTEDDRIVMTIFTVNENKEAEFYQHYIFNYKSDRDDAIFVNYNPDNGEEKRLFVNPEFPLFEKWLSLSINALLGADSHSVNKTLKYMEAKLETKIDAIGGGSSSSSGSRSSYNGRGYKRRNLGISREDLDDVSDVIDNELSEMINSEEVDDLSSLENLFQED